MGGVEGQTRSEYPHTHDLFYISDRDAKANKRGEGQDNEGESRTMEKAGGKGGAAKEREVH